MSFIGRLFGTDKAAEAVINNVSSGIDKIWYTSEEKAEDAAEARREGYAVYMEWLKSTSGSRVARRIIALFTMTIWGLEHVGSVVFKLSAIWASNPETVQKMMESSQMLSDQANAQNALVGVVFAFYFGGPVAVDATKNLITKWAGNGGKG